MKLLLEWDENSEVIDSDLSKTIGRDISADIRINSTKISRVHARIQYSDDGWQLIDLGSSNGTFLKKKKISKVSIQSKTEINLGGIDGLEIVLTPIGSQTTQVSETLLESGKTQIIKMKEINLADSDELSAGRIRLQNRIKIGRDARNDWVLNSLSVSRFHAEINQSVNGDFEIIDLNSANGTFVNGIQTNRQRLNSGDLITLGVITRRFTNSGLEPVEGIDGSTLVVKNGRFEVNDKILLQDINLILEPRTLTAIIGPSGAGKSTLLNLLSGRLSPTSGTVEINDIELEKNRKLLTQKIGFVPQSDIIHSQLTTKQALSFGAELRLSPDTTSEERNARVDEVLEKLELSERKNLFISKLSGGQRKRASIGLELLTSPEILFLDEPTSGLDPGLDAHVMETLRKIADEGQTVALVTHSVDNLNYCDNVVLMASGGKIAYAGPASSVFTVLKKNNWAEVFRFLASPDAILLAQPKLQVPAGFRSNNLLSSNLKRSWIKQTWTLSRRYLRTIAADRYYSTLLVAIPLLTGILCAITGGSEGLGKGKLNKYGFYFNQDARGTILVLILGSVFIGLSTAIQEIVKENEIRKREQSAGLHVRAYLASKLFILGAITAIQSLIFSGIVLLAKPLPNHGLLFANAQIEISLICIILTCSSLVLGLFLSSVLSSQEQAMPVLVGATMAQVILSGALPISTNQILNYVSGIFPSFWGTNALSASSNLLNIARITDAHSKEIWSHTVTTIEQSFFAIVLISMALAVLTGFNVKRKSR